MEPTIVRRYGLAALTVVAAAGARAVLSPWLADQLPFATFFAGVIASALLWGTGPGLLAIALSLGAVALGLGLPGGEPGLISPPGALAQATFAVLAGFLAVAGGACRDARRRLGAAAEQAQTRRQELERALAEQHRIAEELHRERQRAHVTLASIGDGVITTDPRERVTYLNPVAEALLGWSLEEAHGRPLDDVFRIVNEHSRKAVESPVSEVLRAGHRVAVPSHTLLIGRDGTERAIDDSVSLMRDTDGHIAGVVLIFRDVSQERRMAAERSRLAAIVDHSDDAIFSKSLDGRIQSWNAGAQRLYGYAPNEILGRPVSVLVPEEHHEDLRRIMERLHRGEPTDHFETVRRRKDGSRVEVSLSVSPLLDPEGRLVGASMIARDISARRRAESALLRSERELSDFFDNASLAMHWVGPDGQVLRVNRRELDLLGYTEDEYVGRKLADFHADPEVIADMLGRLRAGESLRDYPARMCRKDGSLVDVLIDSNGFFDDDRLVHTRWFVRDVSEHLRKERAMRFLADAGDELANLVDYQSTLEKTARLAVPEFADWCIVDMVGRDGRLRCLALAHVDPAKVALARELQERYPANLDAPLGANHILRTGEPELIPEIPDGLLAEIASDEEHLASLRALHPCSYIGVPLHVRRRTLGVLSFLTAESGRRYDARDLELACDLAHRAALAIHAAQLYRELRESDQRKDEFLATLSHELRNPLAPIRHALEIIRKSPDRPETQARALDLMERQVKQLVRLVDDLLDVSRITLGRLQLLRERVTLSAVLESALDTSRPLIDAAGQKLTVELPDSPIELHADLTRLAQVFSNLLANASKYTPPSGRIAVTAESDATHVIVKVKDEGVGIAPTALPHIFEMFTQASASRDRAKGGLGIGLSLVRALVDLHGGEVHARSEGLGRGSEFLVRLPLAPPTEECAMPPAAEAPDRPPRESCRVLVVDDNLDAATTLQMLLDMQGCSVRVASNGVEALEASSEFDPDVVLLDIGLPEIDGYEVARRLRARPGPQPMLVAVTGWGQDQDRRRSEEAGFDHHFTKPVDLERLSEVLDSIDPNRSRHGIERAESPQSSPSV